MIFQLSTITKATLTAVPAVTTTDCTGTTQQNIIDCVNALRTDLNANLVTAINAYGNPTC